MAKPTSCHFPPGAVEHLRAVQGHDSELVFDWQGEFYWHWRRIQKQAGIHLECDKADFHICSDVCHLYVPHSMRAKYITENEKIFSDGVVTAMARHSTNAFRAKSYVRRSRVLEGIREKMWELARPNVDAVMTGPDSGAISGAPKSS